MVVLRCVAYQLMHCRMCHRIVGLLTGMQVVAAVIAVSKCFRICYVAHCCIEVYATVMLPLKHILIG